MSALAAAFAFLTQLPVRGGEAQPEVLGRSLVFFPAVGLVLGALHAGAGLLLVPHLPGLLPAVAVVALSALLTAGLHLDGVADVCDGLGGGRGDAARTLAIMRDSRIGSFGALALVLVLLAKVATLQPLLADGAWRALVLAPVVARSAAVVLIVVYPYARAEGLGRAFHDHARARHLAVAALMAGLFGVALAPGLLLGAALVCIGTALAARPLARRLGGLTGDVYGAAIELCELAFLIMASVH
jgi:adenosylcobinamide-GDP ribazoletransferase